MSGEFLAFLPCWHINSGKGREREQHATHSAPFWDKVTEKSNKRSQAFSDLVKEVTTVKLEVRGVSFVLLRPSIRFISRPPPSFRNCLLRVLLHGQDLMMLINYA